MANRLGPRVARALLGFTLAITVSGLACTASDETPMSPPGDPPSELPSRLRVVSLSPAATAFVLALGAEATLVGVDPESARIPRLAGLPAVPPADAAGLEPDLVLAPAPEDAGDRPAEELRSRGLAVVEFAPADLREAFDLCRDLGARLADPVRASAFETAIARELAQISGASYGRPRVRVLAVVGVDPLVFADGHSFETDLIEIAGGSSVAHEAEGWGSAPSAAELAASAPDLVLYVSRDELSEDERAAVAPRLPPAGRAAFFAFDPARFWIDDPAGTARRLRALIEPIARELE